ncbi:MAG TPA: DUF4143 domain-containing protein, partial [Candidatus Moranbacteria bacterium]|nr:DUF4143 domain-containing protein [Candidatus Moranbacteria bacterium]
PELETLRVSEKILDLLRLIAFQVGSEVSLQELAGALRMSRNTVEKYLYLLEKAFVLIKVRGFSRNLRKEVTKTARYYFVDVGLRNAVVDNFNPLVSRNDVGQLWENFLFAERIKANAYRGRRVAYYFWRTWDRKEIDLVEERGGKLFGYEFKYNPRKITKAPKDWSAAYSDAGYEVVTPENYLSFLNLSKE